MKFIRVIFSKIKVVVFVLFVISWFVWDFSQAAEQLNDLYNSFRYANEYDALASASAKVAIVRSNDSELSNPTPIDNSSITYETIEEMTRRAINLAGGLWFVKSGNMVLLKPNIVDPEPSGTGEITDVRVVKALIKIIDEIDHGNIEIVVAEGAPRPMNYEMEYARYYSSPSWTKLWDVAGYQDLLTDSDLEGINLRFSNLNCTIPSSNWQPEDGWPADSAWQDMVEIDVPNGGEALPQGGKYFVHQDVINADVFITIPVMKIHEPGITVALKNQIGIVPSTIYGYSKNSGVSQNDYKYQLVHTKELPNNWIDKEIVDMCNIAQIKFAVVDAIACLEKQKEAIRDASGNIINLVRMNTIIAGADPVAVDHVCTRIMGLNPDDIEMITLAEKVGLGTNNSEAIHVKGATIESTMKRFEKSKTFYGDYGQSNRTWILSKAFKTSNVSNPIDYEFIPNESNLAPKEELDNWSPAIYFTEDRINLKNYYQLTSRDDDRVAYLFSYFDAPKNQQAELWLGSDEALKIYINGELAYQYSGTRSFSSDKLVLDKVLVNIKAGENRLLVKTLQKYGRYDFTLNICEPESNYKYDGNRVWGLKFKTIPDSIYVSVNDENVELPQSFNIDEAYPNPFNSSVNISYSVASSNNIKISVYNLLGQKIKTLYNGEANNNGVQVISWDGKNSFGEYQATGTYIVNFQQKGICNVSKKVMFLK
jgi:uncharacterized protein (DUF362 family)